MFRRIEVALVFVLFASHTRATPYFCYAPDFARARLYVSRIFDFPKDQMEDAVGAYAASLERDAKDTFCFSSEDGGGTRAQDFRDSVIAIFKQMRWLVETRD